MSWLKRLLEWLKPDKVMCPTCLGSGCIECDYRGDLSTGNS